MKFNFPEPVKIRKKITDFVTKSGKLRQDFLPASYCDTSFLLDYWLSNKLTPSYFISDEEDHYKIIRETIKKYKKLNEIYKIREKLENYKNLTTPVYSTIALFELAERIAEAFFLSETVEGTDVLTIQRLPKKEIGKYIRSFWEKTEKIRKKNRHSQDPLVTFTLTLFENISNYTSENLFGIIPVDFANITIRTPRDFNKLITFPAYQIGVADILHLVSAKRLGCKYFITFDDDFERAKKDIERFFNLKILTNPQEILKRI